MSIVNPIGRQFFHLQRSILFYIQLRQIYIIVISLILENVCSLIGKSTCAVVTLANWEWFSEYENERVKHRGPQYSSIKDGIAKRMWEQCLALFPQLEDKV